MLQVQGGFGMAGVQTDMLGYDTHDSMVRSDGRGVFGGMSKAHGGIFWILGRSEHNAKSIDYGSCDRPEIWTSYRRIYGLPAYLSLLPSACPSEINPSSSHSTSLQRANDRVERLTTRPSSPYLQNHMQPTGYRQASSPSPTSPHPVASPRRS